MVRNESALMRANLAYHRSVGVDEFLIADNGSSDGTTELLDEEARAHGDVRWTSEPGPYKQDEVLTALAQQAGADGADWIVVADADEFWWTRRGDLRRRLADEPRSSGGIICGVDNFVQRRSITDDDARSILTMTYRARPRGSMQDAMQLVTEAEIAFIEIAYPPKLLLRSSPDLTIGFGNHSSTNCAGPLSESDDPRVLHAPLRSMRDLAARAEDGRRAEEVAKRATSNWHTKRWARMAEGDGFAAEWAANAHRYGWIRVGGKRRRMVRDVRLRDAIAPHV